MGYRDTILNRPQQCWWFDDGFRDASVSLVFALRYHIILHHSLFPYSPHPGPASGRSLRAYCVVLEPAAPHRMVDVVDHAERPPLPVLGSMGLWSHRTGSGQPLDPFRLVLQ